MIKISGWEDRDTAAMQEALTEARSAATQDEVPVGAVVVRGTSELARAHNRTVMDKDPCAHAEVLALRDAARAVGNHRLNGATVYVTLEPCAMCVGAMLQARISRVVFAAYDDRAGAVGSVVDLSMVPEFNHRIEVNGGLLEEDSTALLQAFFEARRDA